MIPRSLSALLIATLLLGQTGGQNPPPPVIKTAVRQVLVPVVVTDQKGRYIADLDRTDFRVFEDGVEQKIVAFSRSPVSSSPAVAENQPSAPVAVPKALLGENPKRTYLICLDNLHSAFENFAQVRTALKKFFSTEEAGDSQYALVALGWKLHVIVDSTRDPATILNALDDKALLKTIQDSEASNIAMETTQFQTLVAKWCRDCNCGNRMQDMANPMCPTYKMRIQSTLLSFSERKSILDRNFLGQLKQLVGATAGMPTRRTVLFISDGFNRFPGRELYNIVSQVSNDPDFKFDPRDLQPELNAILKLAVQYDVRFYTLDSRGLYTPLDGSGNPTDMTVAFENGDAMAQLAHDTGGVFFENTNDLLRGIRRAFADGREEYILAYVPTNTKIDAQFRRISVETKDKKLRIAAKAGYWAMP